jgi:hypothetical protein
LPDEENVVRKQRLISNAFQMLIEVHHTVSKEILENNTADLEAIYGSQFWEHFESDVTSSRTSALLYMPLISAETLRKEQSRIVRIFENTWSKHGGHR